METWSFRTQIYTGSDSLERLQLYKEERILIICDPFLEGSDHLEEVKKQLHKSNYIQIYTDVVPDPPIEKIVKGVSVLHDMKATVLIVIGGGSAIDMAKGVNYFCHSLYNWKVNRFIAIPTTSGTGSEVTSFAVITDATSGVKYPLVDESLLPDEAILTTLFVASAPPKVTAYSGMDVLVHAIEALVAKGANHYTDALAEKAIELVFTHLRTCVLDGTNEEARAAMHEASCMAGLAFNKAGLGITHALAHQLGGQFHVPHGLANTMVLPYAILFNAANASWAKHKYIQLAQKLSLTNESDEANQLRDLIRYIQSLAHDVGCIRTMKEFGVSTPEYMDKIDTLVLAALKDRTYEGNPYAATPKDLARILTCIA